MPGFLENFVSATAGPLAELGRSLQAVSESMDKQAMRPVEARTRKTIEITGPSGKKYTGTIKESED